MIRQGNFQGGKSIDLAISKRIDSLGKYGEMISGVWENI